MPTEPQLVMTFPTLDEAESALDWIGVAFVEADGAFEGTLTADDRESLDEAVADPDTPAPVRELAVSLTRRLDAAGGDDEASWRVVFDG